MRCALQGTHESLLHSRSSQSDPNDGLDGCLDLATERLRRGGVERRGRRRRSQFRAGEQFAAGRKGGGHSYLGASNAPDSLLIWTRLLDQLTSHDAFTPEGCEADLAPQPAVTVGAGAIWMHTYNEVTTKGGRYVQGGGCGTVGVAGLVQGGGFGTYSKQFGIAGASLLEAEIVTADGVLRIANACREPDLFWALIGGGGGTFV
jgi:hypothetical protein